MTSPERDELEELLAGYEPPLWEPFPDRDGRPSPQRRAYESSADVLGYGGAAGGGKSDLLLGLAATQHLRSVIFRREAAQGRGMIDRAREILGGLGRLNENSGVWRGLPGGRQIEFAGVKDPGDEHKHKGRPKDFIGFDEADQFPEVMVRFLCGWLRTTVPGQRCRVVLAFNPPATAEGRWLLSFCGPWVDPRHPRPAAAGELRWYATMPDGAEVERESDTPFEAGEETITPRSRTFVPARVEDNPALMATGYKAQLQALPEPLRSQLLRGDMLAGVEDDPWQVIPTAWVEAAQARWHEDGHGGRPLDALGVDVARGGRDKTVLAPRRGLWFGRLHKHPGASTPDGAAVIGLVLPALRGNPAALVCIDVIGVGSSPYDWGKATGIANLLAVDFGAGTDARDASGRLGFANVRAFAWWSMREALDPASGLLVSLPPDPELLADLTAPRWKVTLRGIQIEDKGELSKRIGRSPDAGDAVVLAALSPPQASDAGPSRLVV